MSSTDYTYDEQGQFFPFFILTVTSLVTIPLTYSVLKPTKELESTAPRISSDFQAPQDDLIQAQKRRQKRRERKLKRMIAAAVGWLVMAWMVYLIIVTQRTIPKIWDPYDILGIRRVSAALCVETVIRSSFESQSASEKEISKHYKRLSLKFHPDKVRPDASKNETIEMLNDRFVELTKAYKALTDEEIRNNYIQYGHPDGKQSFSIGIALPKFIISEGNGKYVLLFYAILFGVLLPYTVGKWWYGTQALTKDKVLINSASKLFKEYKDEIKEPGLVGALSVGDEYGQVLPGTKSEEGLSKIEKAVLASNALNLSPADRRLLQNIEDPVRRKTLGLLWAYLGRIDLKDATLDSGKSFPDPQYILLTSRAEKYEAAAVAFRLNDAFTSITLAFGQLAPLLSSFRTSQHLVQAIAPGSSPLLQLPYFTPELVATINKKKGNLAPYTLQSFMSLPDARRRELASSLTSDQYKTAMHVASQLPYLTITKPFFKVIGERHVTPSSLVQFVIKCRFIPPGAKGIPEPAASDLLDVDPEEGDVDAILGRNKPTPGKPGQSNKNEPIVPPLAHAPYFARDHSPRWHIFLTDAKQGRIAVPPFTFTAFDKPIFNDDGTPTYNVQTLKCQFQAPPQVGNFIFTYEVVCDSYIGLDSTGEVIMDVVDPSTIDQEEDVEDDISEPDEGRWTVPLTNSLANPIKLDSIAGQMAALKEGGVGALAGGQPPRRKKKIVREDSDDSDDSDTEGDASDISTTDTETDEE